MDQRNEEGTTTAPHQTIRFESRKLNANSEIPIIQTCITNDKV
jgi:hypothetical protein